MTPAQQSNRILNREPVLHGEGRRFGFFCLEAFFGMVEWLTEPISRGS